jgi:hypothetical protein
MSKAKLALAAMLAHLISASSAEIVPVFAAEVPLVVADHPLETPDFRKGSAASGRHSQQTLRHRASYAGGRGNEKARAIDWVLARAWSVGLISVKSKALLPGKRTVILLQRGVDRRELATKVAAQAVHGSNDRQ